MSPPRSARHVLGATFGAVLALTGCQEPEAALDARVGARTPVLTHLRQARERAGDRWHSEEVLADPLFERFRRDTGPRAVVGSP